MKGIMYNTPLGLNRLVKEGHKPQTRRVMKIQPQADWKLSAETYFDDNGGSFMSCFWYKDNERMSRCFSPPYQVGDTVAIKESYEDLYEQTKNPKYLELRDTAGWRNKMFVKTELMQCFQRVISVRAERLQEISDEDCRKEGITHIKNINKYYFENKSKDEGFYFHTPNEAFGALINRVSGKSTWRSNPYVWVYEFELIKKQDYV